jgi:ribosomal protein S18 acetylase RimI-like enzyme
MTESAPETQLEDVMIRLAKDADHPEILHLYQEGLLAGHLRGNDTGADIEQLKAAYFADDGASAFWVACHGGDVIGMIGVQKTNDNTAEIRRMRVCETFRRRGVGSRLLEQATTFCRKQGYLKVVLDVRIEREPAIAMFEKFGFILVRTREHDNHKMMDFYLDLYTDPGS